MEAARIGAHRRPPGTTAPLARLIAKGEYDWIPLDFLYLSAELDAIPSPAVRSMWEPTALAKLLEQNRALLGGYEFAVREAVVVLLERFDALAGRTRDRPNRPGHRRVMERISPQKQPEGSRAAASRRRPTGPRSAALLSILLVALASSACASSSEEGTTTQIVVGRTVQRGPEAPDVIPRSSFATVIPRIAALRVHPAEIVLVPGQRFALDSLRVTAFDAEGRELGRLPVFDRRMEPGAAVLDMGWVAARRQGESLLILTPSLWEQYGRGRSPSAEVPVHVN